MRNLVTKLLSESTGIQMSKLAILSEAQFVGMNENILAKMFESVGQKYNEIDFAEIEKSKGNFTKFKYRNLIIQNQQMLEDLYSRNEDPTVQPMTKYAQAVGKIIQGLESHAHEFTELYDNAIVSVIYNTAVANVIYSTTLLLSTTVRFITVDKDTDIELIIDSLPNAEKNIFLGNSLKLAEAFENDIPKLLTEMMKQKSKAISETAVIDMDPMAINEAVLTIPLVVLLIPVVAIALTKVIPIIREIIYGVYHIRVSMEQAIDYQIDLISSNIEVLEDNSLRNTNSSSKKKYKKVIARQRRVVEKLDRIKKAVAIKFDVAENQAKKDIVRDNREIGEIKAPSKSYSSDLMI